ncbi:hypothetical protein CALCODRAFT_499931 [Calocera cornea HHB12733]|uniref:Uncharacterized protein n=1 Tax=Calocera cornea HHB12733 TaxID=1353952 RepID=A0A165E9U8_9BASI|nr:hypothetical protein CALCODRAFT_499931 [Calocera cornea HHB12733]
MQFLPTSVVAVVAVLLATVLAGPIPLSPDHDPSRPHEDAWCGGEHCIDYRREYAGEVAREGPTVDAYCNGAPCGDI